MKSLYWSKSPNESSLQVNSVTLEQGPYEHGHSWRGNLHEKYQFQVRVQSETKSDKIDRKARHGVCEVGVVKSMFRNLGDQREKNGVSKYTF